MPVHARIDKLAESGHASAREIATFQKSRGDDVTREFAKQVSGAGIHAPHRMPPDPGLRRDDGIEVIPEIAQRRETREPDRTVVHRGRIAQVTATRYAFVRFVVVPVIGHATWHAYKELVA